jgi:hypothetical protein
MNAYSITFPNGRTVAFDVSDIVNPNPGRVRTITSARFQIYLREHLGIGDTDSYDCVRLAYPDAKQAYDHDNGLRVLASLPELPVIAKGNVYKKTTA